MKRRQTYLLETILLILALALITSCGGGGGGGGGGAVGPAPASSEESTETEPTQNEPIENEPVAPEPERSAAAEIISFKFEQAKNSPALSALSSDLEGRLVNNQIIVDYNYGSLDTHPQLIPTIKISPSATITEDCFTQTLENGETIWTTNDATDFFTNAVTFTVKAENGTVKQYIVILNEMAPGEHRIIYRPEGIIDNPYPATYNESQEIQFNENPNKVTVKNYYFDGWYAEDSRTTPVTGWGRMEKTDDVILYAKLQPAPYVDLEKKKIFANGIPVTVKNNASTGKPMVYFDADGTEKPLSDVNEHYDIEFIAYDLYAGTSGDANAANIDDPEYGIYTRGVNSGNITITSGKFNNVYGGTGTNPKTPLIGRSEIYLSGNPEIGNTKKSGIWLTSFSDKKIKVNESITGDKITLIAAPGASAGDVVVEAEASASTSKDQYTLRNSCCTETVELENTGNNVTIKASITLPDPENVTWSRDPVDGNYFTLGPDHFHSDGTILSIGVEDGFFKLSSTTVTGGNFDMAIRYSDNSLNVYVDKYIDGDSTNNNTITTNDKLKYVQFISESGDITASAASNFLEDVHFFIESGKSSVKIKLNLQTVPLADIRTRGVTYFNGSFYEIDNTYTTKNWEAALSKAKSNSFNGLTGYLMTITSQTENMFIYDRVYKKKGINQSAARGWIGAKLENGKWKWACGPEEGIEFYDQTDKEPINGMFAAWDSFKDRMRNDTWSLNGNTGINDNGEPLYNLSNWNKTNLNGINYPNAIKALANANPDDKYYWPEENKERWYVDWDHPKLPEPTKYYNYAYYTGIYAWGNEKDSHGIIIEYTAYNGSGGTPDAPVLIAEKDYSRR